MADSQWTGLVNRESLLGVRRALGTGPRGHFLTMLIPALVGILVARLLVASPVLTLAAIAGVIVVGALLVRVELAALVFVAVEPFEDYAKSLSGSAIKGLGAILILSWLIRLVIPSLGEFGREKGYRPRGGALKNPVVLAALTLLAIALASTVVHPNGSIGLQVLVRYLSFIGALVVLVDCMYKRLSVRLVVIVFVASCTVSSVVGLVNYFSGAVRTGGPIGDPNDFAFFLVAALPLSLGLRRTVRHSLLCDIAALLIGLSMAGTLSRGALAGVLGIVIFALLTRLVRLKTVIIGVLALAAVLGITLFVQSSAIQNSLHQKQFVAQQNIDERLVRWRAAAEMAFDYPVLGLGPAGFRLNYDRWVGGDPSNLVHRLDVAHETYLEAASELGLPGLAAFLAILVLGFAGAYRRGRLPDADDWYAGAVCAGLIGTAIAALFLTEQYYLPLWLLAALGAAMDPRVQTIVSDFNNGDANHRYGGSNPWSSSESFVADRTVSRVDGVTSHE
jgi:O-antigen ligase